MDTRAYLRRFAVKGVFWRHILDWGVVNIPFYLQPVLLTVTTAFFFFFAAPARRAIVSNLAVVFPGAPRWMNHLRAFRTLWNFAWTISDAASYKLRDIALSYEIVGAEFLQQLSTAPGAIVLTAHMGNYDLGAAIFAEKFHREIRMVRAPEPDESTAQHLDASMEQTGKGAIKISYSTDGSHVAFDLLNAVRQGEIVSIQGDRNIPGIASAEGHIFGEIVRVPSGPFTLAQIAQVAIYPLFIVRTGFRRYRIVACEPILVPRSGPSRDEDLARAVAAWCSVLERAISQYWDQWFALAPIFSAHAAN